MTFTVEMFRSPVLLSTVRVVHATTGVEAAALTAVQVAEQHADHADLLVDDGTGVWLYYTTVRAEGGAR